MNRARQKHSLVVLAWVAFVLTLVLLQSELDRQYYQVEKESIIKYNFAALFPHDTMALQTLSADILAQHADSGLPDAEKAEAWRNEAQGMLSGTGCVFHIRVVSRDGVELLALADSRKFETLNTWGNTLFYRNFQNVVSYEIVGPGAGSWTGLLSFHYTTPEGYAPVEDLTRRYRLVALLMLLVLTGVFLLAMRKLILPVKRVIDRMDAEELPTLMPKPASMLEHAYNNLVRDAILLRVGQSMSDALANNPTANRVEVLSDVPRMLVDMLGYRAALLCDVSLAPGVEDRLLSCTVATRGDPSRAYLQALREQALTRSGLLALQEEDGAVSAEGCTLLRIGPSDNAQPATCLGLFADQGILLDAGARAWHADVARQVAHRLHESLVLFDLQRRHIQMERSRANINLARNIGHDLTNVIATCKLDMFALQKLLQREPDDAGERDVTLRESASGLSANLKVLQELVDIYRSFGYINKPVFEDCTLHDVLDEIVEVFSLSLPSHIELRRTYTPGLPVCRVEPRLLKLALFNVLSNALKAIKRRHADVGGEGLIEVITEPVTDGDRLCIRIRDNGTGILDAEGKRAPQADIDAIFRYGVSGGADTGGEGLGLSWVQSIIQEIHHGDVVVRNTTDGAEFELRLPLDPEPVETA